MALQQQLLLLLSSLQALTVWKLYFRKAFLFIPQFLVSFLTFCWWCRCLRQICRSWHLCIYRVLICYTCNLQNIPNCSRSYTSWNYLFSCCFSRISNLHNCHFLRIRYFHCIHCHCHYHCYCYQSTLRKSCRLQHWPSFLGCFWP